VSSLEQIVRPFVRVDVAPSPAPAVAPATKPDDVAVRIGLGGSAKTMASSTTYSITYYMQKLVRERQKPPTDRRPGDDTPTDTKKPPSPSDTFMRVCHIVRFYQNDDETSDVWIDIERLSQLVMETGSGPTFKHIEFEFDWTNFDPNDENQGYFKEITSPDDPDVKIRVPVRHNILVEQGEGADYQATLIVLDSTEANTSRNTYVRRVFHYEVPGANAAPGADPDSALFKPYLNDRVKSAPPQAYYDAVVGAANKDESQYVDAEVIDSFVTEEEISGRDLSNFYMMDPKGGTSFSFFSVNPNGGGMGIKTTTWELKTRQDLLLQDPLVPGT
jgi:hypothetical protein